MMCAFGISILSMCKWSLASLNLLHLQQVSSWMRIFLVEILYETRRIATIFEYGAA
jgi:hypothetical protein